jgi:hypothetical protein
MLTDEQRAQYGLPSRQDIAARAAAAAAKHATLAPAGAQCCDPWLWLREMVVAPLYSPAAWTRWYEDGATTAALETVAGKRR